MSQKNQTETCKNCHYFDDSKHRNDERTKCAGICQKFFEVVFKNDKQCKDFMKLESLPDWNEITKPKTNEIINQLELF